MIKEFSFWKKKIIRWWENVETYIYLTIEIGVSFFFSWVGWWVGNWLPIDLSYERNGTTIKVVVLSRGLKFFFSRSFRYLLTKSIVRSRTSFFSVIKLQRINNPFNLAPRLFVTHIHTHTHKPISSSSELGLIFTISYRFSF